MKQKSEVMYFLENKKIQWQIKKMVLVVLFACGTVQNIFSQANQSLSNLTSPTAINQHLIPSADNTTDLGSSALRWKDFYFNGSMYKATARVIQFSGTNTAIGTLCLNTNTGNYNTALGSYSIYSNTSGSGNTGSGQTSLFKNTTGSFNTASGRSALYNNTTGYSNVAIGVYALYNNTDRSNLVAVGDSALFNNGKSISFSYEAIDNTAVGSKALYANTSGYNNSALGYNALYANTTGNRNTAMGNEALKDNTTGYQNTGIGSFALTNNTNGYSNNALGYYTLYTNTTGDQNTGIGNSTLYSNTTGNSNTGIGQAALNANTTGSNNTAVGFSSGGYNNSNTYCTFLGNDADQAVSTDFTNAMALGNTSRITASNQVRIGNSSVTSIGGYASWTNISDGRVKQNIKENVPGLKFINKLKAVTYNLDITSLSNTLRENEDKNAVMNDIRNKEKLIQTGFVAQEVEKAAKEIGYEFSGVDAPKNKDDYYGLRYAEFVVPLVKAVQELSTQNDVLKAENETLKSRLDKIEALLSQQSVAGQQPSSSANNQLSIITNQKATLEQNAPNPFSNNTVIKYNVPASVNNAQIIITDNKGIAIKTMSLTQKGNGQVSLSAGTLAAGTYYYTLVTDGKKADTKQMQISR